MLLVLVLAGLAVAVLSRRSAWVRDRLPVPATTILAWTAAGAVGLGLADVGGGTGRTVLSGVVAVVAGVLAVAAAGWLVGLARPRLARRRARRAGGPPVAQRAVALADRHPLTVRGWGVASLAVRSVVRSGEVRITGLAAEMTYYALISLVPIATALGASLGYLRPLLGDEQVDEIRTSVVDGLATVFAQQVASDVLAPLVDGLLDERRGGFALGALAVTLYLASRVFRAAVRALDDAYRVESRQNVVTQYLLGFAFTVGALVTLVTVLLLVVVGPLLGGGDALAARLGLGDAFRAAWSVLRWPAALALGGAFLALLYRYAPNVVSTWRRCLPGAVAGTLGVLLVSTGFVAYVAVAVPDTPGADAGSAAVVQAAAQMLGLVLAAALWIWLSSIAVLLGGVLNAEVDAARPRARRVEPAAPVAVAPGP
ncbi:YihY/virulence factor BrkB family protein [Cellulomonas sp. PS-H5]|uniref:YihY/virulence factor BrkB family protein n=1 Tax=Cellulomonas sp. PS-H5 TaxID=2820400 RepID=UPI001C4F3E91|nr:YihY/virulence factor BrkB family protein [Cellulomonas sp. PS-H5]MBW0254080.1 YihY/virulence factor BrkB family protein [Cellulomonas sp. PS-H5]